MATACKPLLVGFLIVAGAVVTAESSSDANLTVVNDCEYPVWPKIIPNDGYSPISTNTARLDSRGVASFRIPGSPGAAWSGQVMARTGCAVETPEGPSRCASGEALPATVVQLQAHAYGRADMAVYSVSLSGGFNVPATVTPHAFPRGSVCPVLGCTEDLNPGCPQGRRVVTAAGAVIACRSDPAAGGYFKQRCPKTLTGSGDSVDVDQRCVAPAELKVIFCPRTMVTTAGADGDDGTGLIRAAFAEA
ncbi:hypothetical protein BS78_08G112500 [Paspalum vaginatum]|nr:hypothetical protein BS78_08G112500 [Paspalum vaginatum]